MPMDPDFFKPFLPFHRLVGLYLSHLIIKFTSIGSKSYNINHLVCDLPMVLTNFDKKSVNDGPDGL